MQGVLEVLRIPYTGSGVLASAIAMDKAMTKAILQVNDIPVPPGVVLQRSEPLKRWPVSMKFPTGGKTEHGRFNHWSLNSSQTDRFAAGPSSCLPVWGKSGC